MKIHQLALPTFDHKIVKQEGKIYIWDVFRKKYIILTPEEWVRQHYLHFLVSKGYPKNLIRVEGGLTYNALQKRSDILVYDRQMLPFLLIECKAPTVMLAQKTLNQALVYNHSVQAKYVAITNGLQNLYYEFSQTGSQLMETGLPTFPNEDEDTHG